MSTNIRITTAHRQEKNNPVHSVQSYYIYGQHAVIAAALNPQRKIGPIYCLERHSTFLKNTLPQHDIRIVDNHFISQHVTKDAVHQGMIALVNTIFKANLNEITFYPIKDRIIILDQITDPHNIGAIIRSAAAFGIDKVILPKDSSPMENAIIAKAACGCLELVQILKVTNIVQTIRSLQKQGFWVFGLDAKGNNLPPDYASIDKVALVIGSEAIGMRHLVSKSCDFLVKIPIAARVESLNASCAASIMFYLFTNIL